MRRDVSISHYISVNLFCPLSVFVSLACTLSLLFLLVMGFCVSHTTLICSFVMVLE